MSPERLFFLPGNGHGPMRLRAARKILARLGRGPELIEARYAAVDDFGVLLDDLAEQARRAEVQRIYATGIGGLVALAQRARGRWIDKELVLQGAVLWGLEKRVFPRVMKYPPLPWLLAKAFGLGALQRHFVKKHFERPLAAAERREFFAGYGDAAAFANWFRWLTSGLLRGLEREFGDRPEALEHIEFWWGEKDRVVGLEELRVTERALGKSFQLRTFPTWSHYPMIDDPEGWAKEVSADVAHTRIPS